MYKDKNATRTDLEEPKPNNQWKNLGKLIFLLAALIAAWFILEWLFGIR